MACVRSMMVVCAATLSLSACVGSTEPIGAPAQSQSPGAASAPAASRYDPADVSSDDVKAVANFAVAEQARRTGYTLTLGAIRRAEQQNVVVTNYRLCLDLDTEGSSEHALAVVLRDPGSRFTLTSWTNTPCE